MSKNKNPINLETLNNYLFETIEMLKNNSDPEASENEKIDVETAKTIAELGKVAVDGFRVKATVLSTIAKSREFQKELIDAAVAGGFIPGNDQKSLTS